MKTDTRTIDALQDWLAALWAGQRVERELVYRTDDFGHFWLEQYGDPARPAEQQPHPSEVIADIEVPLGVDELLRKRATEPAQARSSGSEPNGDNN